MKTFLKTLGLICIISGFISIAHIYGLYDQIYNNGTVAAFVLMFGLGLYIFVD